MNGINENSRLLETESVASSYSFFSTTSIPETPHLFLSWKSVSVYGDKKKTPISTPIILNCTGTLAPGELLAVLGPSGSGKTTLLNALVGTLEKNQEKNGGVWMNGLEVDSLTASRVANIAYTTQKEDLMDALTVSQHLHFHASIRLPTELRRKSERVELTLREFGLLKCRNTTTNKISLAERKLLSLASEMMAEPSLLVSDEPLTGLDSSAAAEIASLFDVLISLRKSVIVSLHQPTSDIFEKFDKILLLTEGRTAFFGSTASALEFFNGMGLRCPTHYNPADFFVENLSIVPQEEIGSRVVVDKICEFYADSEIHRKLENSIEFENLSRANKEETPHFAHSKPKTFAESFTTLFHRAFLSTKRKVLVSNLCNKLIMGLFIGAVYWKTNLDQAGIQNIKGVQFFLLAQLSFAACLGVIQDIHKEFHILLSEIKAGLYHMSAYYWSKCLSLALCHMVNGVLMVGVSYWMIGLNTSTSSFLLTLLVAFLSEQCATAFGVFLSTVTPRYRLSLGLVGPLLTVTQIMGGLMVNVATYPVFISWLQYVSFWRYAFEALSIVQWSSISSLSCSFTDDHDCVPTGAAVLQSLSFSPDNLPLDISMIFVLTVVFYILGYFCLFIRLRLNNVYKG